MNLSFRTQLLLSSVLLMLITGIGISVANYSMIRQDKQREFQQRIHIAFDIIFDDLDNRIRTYTQRFNDLLTQNLSFGSVTDWYAQDPTRIRSETFILSYLTPIATEVKQFSQGLSVNRLSLYAADKRLLATYQRFDEEFLGIYIQTTAGEDGYIPLDPSAKVFFPVLTNPQPMPVFLAPARYPDEIPETIQVAPFSRDTVIGIRIVAPIYQKQVKTGLLVGEVIYTPDIVARYASLSKTDINFFAAQTLSAGTLPAQTEIAPDVLTQGTVCDALHGATEHLVVTLMNIDHQRYYQGQCRITNQSGQAVGAITVSLSQQIEQQAIRQILLVIIVIAVCVTAFAFGLTASLSRKSLRFIQQQIAYIDRLARGDIPEKITEPCHGELEMMKQNLNRLIDVSEETTRLAEEVAAGNLKVEVRERSEEDRLMQALNAMIRRLTRFSNELDGLVHAVSDGDLTRRGNPAIFGGGWKHLVDGVNNVIDAFVETTRHNERLHAENLRMGAELDIARRLQQMVLPMPQELTQIAGLDIVGYMQPADEVGGNYYDVLPCQHDRVCIGIGDVTGHGLESGVLMLMTQTAIRTLIDRGENDPVVFLNTLNRVIYQNIQRMGVDHSITLAMMNYEAGQVRLIGQHEEALIVRHDGTIERMDTVNLGFPIGMVDDIRAWIGEEIITLSSGDGVVLYTDGITEAQNTEKKLYGLERLCAVISAIWRNSTAEAVKEAIIDNVRAFIGGAQVYDDVTLVVLKQK